MQNGDGMKKNELSHNLILCAAIAAEIALSMYFTYTYGENNIDADNSSEMVLSKLLSEEGGFLSRNWFYSTELRVLNTQLVLSLLFRISDSWRLVRTLGSGILMAVMVCSYLYMAYEAGLGRRGKAFSVFLLMPFCHCYQQFVLFGLYYIPHVSIAFAAAGLFFGARKKNRFRKIKAALSLLLAFVAGLGGIRMLVTFYCPLLLASLAYCAVSRSNGGAFNRREAVMPLASAVLAGTGYAVNVLVLSEIFTFKSFTGTEFSNPDIFARSDRIINGLLSFLGYSDGRRVMGPGLAANLLALFMLVFLAYMLVKMLRSTVKPDGIYNDNERMLILLFAASFCLNMFTFYFADMWEDNGNYLIPVMIWIIPLSAVYFNHADMKNRIVKYTHALVICAFIISSVTVYSEWKDTDINEGKEGVIKYLVNNGYKRGYADFWDANVFTELSEGELLICNIRNFDESFSTLEWLMDKRYTEWDGDDGRVFIIVDNAFSWENRDRLSYLDRSYMVASNTQYCVFAFESDRELARIVEEGKNRE